MTISLRPSALVSCSSIFGEEAKTEALAEWLKISTKNRVFRPGGPVRRARKSARWKIMINEDVEVPE